MQALVELQALPPESTEMPSAPQKFAEIDRRLANIEERIATIASPPRLPARLYTWAINHKGTSLALSIVLCGISVIGGGYFKFWLDHRYDDLNSRIDGRIREALNAPHGVIERLDALKTTTDETNTTLKALQPFIHDVIDHQFESASKLSPQALVDRLPAIENLLTVAQSQHVNTNLNAVANVGSKLVGVSADNLQAWNAALAFANYRSTFNVYTRTVPTRPFSPGEHLYAIFDVLHAGDKPLPELGFTAGPTYPSDAALIRKIGESVNDEEHFGAVEMWVTGGAVKVDDVHYKHVFLKNVEVHYSGGPLVLEDVIFINCTFVFDNTAPTRILTRMLLASSPVINFSQGRTA